MIGKVMKYLRKSKKHRKEDSEEVSASDVVRKVEAAPEYENADRTYPIEVWSVPVEERMAHQSEFARLQETLDGLDAQIKATEEGILQMKSKLDAKFTREVGELYTLRAQLEAEFLRMTQTQRNEERFEDDADKDPNGLSEEERVELERIEDEVSEGAKERREREKEMHAAMLDEAKKLVRKISMLTHPDRVKDKQLHLLGDEARKAFEKQDYARLHEIWRIIDKSKASPSKLFEALMSRIAMVRDDIEKKQRRLKGLFGEQEFGMWRDYQKMELRARVEKHYHDVLLFNINQTKQVLASMGARGYDEFLREEVSKDDPSHVNFHAKPSDFSKNPDSFQTGSVMQEIVDNELDSPWAEE